MVRALKNLLRRPASRGGRAGASPRRFRDPRFVSFLAANNRKTLNTDFQDAVLQGRRLFKQVLVVLLIAGGAWVVLESARALTVF
jgi:hypothetical protein